MSGTSPKTVCVNDSMSNVTEIDLDAEVDVDEEPDVENDENATKKLTQIPLARVKKIMKNDPDIANITNEALFLITKATEMFIESFSDNAHSFLAKSRSKTLKLEHLKQTIDNHDHFQFLEGVLE